MNTTKILGEAVGIQRQDIIDRTEEQTADGLTGAVILGRFKRGRLDAPMEIHQGNIRGQLGYDPKNPDYIAIQDCLDTGVPSVQVLRLSGGISCTPNKLIIPASTWQWDQNNGLSMLCELWIDDVLDRTGRIKLSSGECTTYFTSKGQFTADQMLLNAMFFYSGHDLYRQSMFGVQNFAMGASGTSNILGDGLEIQSGNYLPLSDRNFYLEGYPSSNADNGNFDSDRTWGKTSIELRFKVDNDLPDGYSDLVQQLWGNEPPTLFSCARFSWIHD